MKPIYKIIVNDSDITATVREHFSSLSINDSSGLDTDSFTLVLEDTANKIAWPKKGVLIKVWLGYNSDLHYKGQFIVDDIDHNSPMDKITIHCRAADISSIGNGKKNKNWGSVSLGSIINNIASQHNLIPAASPVLAGISVPATYQTDETDLNFLARIAERYEAIAQVKNGRLLLLKKGTKTTASGMSLPTAIINKKDTSSVRYNERRNDEKDSVKVSYLNKTTTSGVTTFNTESYKAGGGGNAKEVNEISINQDEAKASANQRYTAINANASTLDITMSHADPSFFAEMEVQLSGFLPRYNDLDWVINDVSLTLNNSGLSGSLKLIRPIAYAELIKEKEEGK